MNLAASLRDAATRFPGKPCMVMDERTLTYLQFEQWTQRLASRLVQSNIRPGDRLAIQMDNGPEFALSYFACFYAGIIAVPLYTRLNTFEIEYILEHSGAAACLTRANPSNAIERVLSRLPWIRRMVIDECELDAGGNDLGIMALPEIAADQPAVVIYTSGTTARPKGVVHTHRTLPNAARGFGIARDDIPLIMTSMAHSSGLMLLVATINAAAAAAVVAEFDSDAVLEAIARHRSTYLFGTPTMYWTLVEAQRERPRDVSSGRRYFAGADAVATALQDAFACTFGRWLHEGFGTTETGVIAVNWGEDRVGSFGQALAGIDIAVVGANGIAVPTGSEGEMSVRHPGNMLGYWDDPETTCDALNDGWFRTGDLVHQDADGFLWFRGRKKEVIVRGGSKIAPQEVEAVLCQHAAVQEAGIVGVPDSLLGERVVGFVSLRPGYESTAEDLVTFVGERMAGHKVPSDIVFLERLPKSQAGKVQRRLLRDRYLVSRA